MSRVARSARVGSRQRTETITASKTIASAETGELYFINHNAASTVTITLPAVQDGAYFKFYWITAMTDDSAVVVIQSADGSDTMRGRLIALEVDGSTGSAGVMPLADNTNDTKITIDGNTDMYDGSWIELWSDGSKWYANGVIWVVAGATYSASVVFG
tara:strand:- start:84 stop:557 length:474 start_codon:yes stop_codon:yes gene_type:complete